MKKFLTKALLSVCASILSAILLYAIFLPVNMPLFAWIALMPFLISLAFARCLWSLFLGLILGTIFCGLHVLWVTSIPGVPLAAFLGIALYTGLFYGLFGFLYTLISQRTRWPRVIIAPVLWVVVEYLRSNSSFLAIPYGLIAHSQYENILLIQMASFTSVYGISFLVVLVNGALAEGFLWLIARKRGMAAEGPSSFAVAVSILASLFLVLASFSLGGHQVKTLDSNPRPILTASLIQGNIPQSEIWDSNFHKKIRQRYHELTLEASQKGPDLIIWPESSTTGYLINEPVVHLWVKNIIRQGGVPILLGSSSRAKSRDQGKTLYKKFNSAFFVENNGKIAGTYNKIRPVPFWEYLPLEGKLSWPKWLVPKHGVTIPGKSPTVFQFQNGNFGVVICWENLFPDLFRQFVNNGAQFMVNLTNEAIFEKTAAPRQLMAMSVFRAVENRVSLLRCANTGISCLIDPVGRVRAKLQDENGNDLMVTGILTVSVPESKGPTFYTKHGDVFAIGCTILALLAFISALLPLKIRKGPLPPSLYPGGRGEGRFDSQPR